MLTVNLNGQKVSLWGTLAQVAIASIATYGMAKAENPQVSWTGYRDSLINNIAQVVLPYAVQNIPGMAQQAEKSPAVDTSTATAETAAQ